jgi:Secretion system C-terminal sorting domain
MFTAMNKLFTSLRGLMPLMLGFCLLFMSKSVHALTTVISTDTSWRVYLQPPAPPASWLTAPAGSLSPLTWKVPGGGKSNCGQLGISGVNKIWYPNLLPYTPYQTCYFRKSFMVDKLCEVQSLVIEAASDDEFTLYVNGNYIGIGGAAAKTMTIPVSYLRCGENVIAIKARDIAAACWWMSARATLTTNPINFTVSTNATATNPICAGTSLQLFASGMPAGATYSWTGPSGFVSNLQNPVIPFAAITATGIYTVTASYGQCCKYTLSIKVGVKNCCDISPVANDCCLDFTSKGIKCIGGVYYFSFCVKNNSGHNIQQVKVFSTTAGVNYTPNIFSVSLAPGQTYCNTVVVSGPNALAGNTVCMKAELVEIDKNKCEEIWFCISKNELCLPLPFCPVVQNCDSVKVSFAPNIITICKGDSVQLNPIVSPAAGLSYLWTPATGLSTTTIKNPWAKPIVTTNYVLVVSLPGTNCIRESGVTVIVKDCQKPCDSLSVAFNPINLTICRGDSVKLNPIVSPASGVTYTWTPPAGLSSTSIKNPWAKPTTTTAYTLTVAIVGTNGQTLCKRNATVNVTVKDCPKPCDSLSVAFNPTTVTICKGDSVQLNPIVAPSSGVTYLWTPPTGLSSTTIKNPWAKPLVTTTYVLAVGIKGTTCLREAVIQVIVKDCQKPCDSLSVAFNPINLTICRGDSVKLNPIVSPASGVTYTWTPPAGLSSTSIKNPWAKPLATTTYILTVGIKGTTCMRQAIVNVVVKDCANPCQTLSVGFNPNVVTVCKGDSVQLNPIVAPATGVTYTWSPPAGLSSSNIKNPWAKPLATTVYILKVSILNTDGLPLCIREAPVTVFVKDCPPATGGRIGTGEGNANSSEGVKVFPNPTQDELTVEMPDNLDWKSVQLVNQQGVSFGQQERQAGSPSVKFNLRKAPIGSYLILIQTTDGQVVKKIVKE